VAGFVVVTAPVYPVVWDHWDLFHRWTASTLVVRALPPDAGADAMLSEMGAAGLRSVGALFGPALNEERRYFPPDRPLLSEAEAVLFLLGLFVSLRRSRSTAL
jgi:hypothetical protein